MAKNEKQKEENQALTAPTTKAVAAYDYGDDMVQVGKGVASGYEHQTAADAQVPWIVLLQAGSPVVAENKIPGAAAGMFMNTVTGQLFDARAETGKPQTAKEPVVFVPATTRHEFVRWKKRDAGGGLVGRYEIDSPVVAKAVAEGRFGNYEVDGDDLVETFYVFGVLCKGEEPEGMAVIGFTSTKIKAYKNWNSKVRAHTISINGEKYMPPLYAHIARMYCEFEKFNEGSAWVTKIEPLNGAVKDSLISKEDPRFQMAKLCKEMVEQGQAKVDYAKQNTAQADAAGGQSGTPF